jgi:DNA-binding winged helix-turn-helix (wHTH) protein
MPLSTHPGNALFLACYRNVSHGATDSIHMGCPEFSIARNAGKATPIGYTCPRDSPEKMPEPPDETGPPRRYRFGAFEADAATGELRRQGIRLRLNAQPFQVLCLLLDRPGELLTRDDIVRALWPDGVNVDAEHGIHSAVNRIREALGDSAASPRFIETLARRGYRFVAPVQRIDTRRIDADGPSEPAGSPDPTPPDPPLHPPDEPLHILTTPDELPKVPHPVARNLFLGFQLMYLGFYIGALANLAEIQDLLAPLTHPVAVFAVLIVTAAILIPVRAFLFSAVLFRAPRLREKYLRVWPFLLPFDVLWSLSPFLLLHHINMGLALAGTALLVWSPFVQRSLILMGAGSASER